MVLTGKVSFEKNIDQLEEMGRLLCSLVNKI